MSSYHKFWYIIAVRSSVVSMPEHEEIFVREMAPAGNRHISRRLIGPLILAVSGGLGLYASTKSLDRLNDGLVAPEFIEIDAGYSQNQDVTEERFLHLGILSILQMSGAAIWFTLSYNDKD